MHRLVMVGPIRPSHSSKDGACRQCIVRADDQEPALVAHGNGRSIAPRSTRPDRRAIGQQCPTQRSSVSAVKLASNRLTRSLPIAGLICFLVFASAGCSRSKSTPAAQGGATGAHEVSSNTKSPVNRANQDTLPESSIDLSNPEESVTTTEDVVTSPPSKTPSPAPPKTGRIMLLAKTGPLLIDLHITHEGQAIAKTFQDSVDQIMKIAKESDSEPLTWKALLAHPRFRDGQFGNPATGSYQAQADAIRQYDTTKNGRVDRNEFVRYLTNNQTSRGLSFFTSNHRQRENREGSWIAEWLDRDSNRRLDAREVANAAERLLLRDIDDDGLLTSTELSEFRTQAPGMQPNRSRSRTSFAPTTGWLFEANETNYPWSDIRVAWENAYSAGQPLRPQDLGRGARLFEQLDLDADGSLDTVELEMLTEIPATLSFDIDFGSGLPTVKLAGSRIPPVEIIALVQHQSNRVTLRIADLVVDFFGIGSRRDEAERLQVETYVMQTDKDADGLISADEFAGAAAPFLGQSFENLDLNNDDALSVNELVTLAGQRTLLNRNRLRVRADGQADALFALLDINADGRLDAREVSEASNSLSSLDKNGDGQLRASEYNDALLVGIALGDTLNSDPSVADATLSPPVVRKQTSESIPRWFAGMDRNGDQNISWREFLGTREQFQALDQDADGFIDTDEAGNG